MDLKKLKALLDSKAITQEEFDLMASKLEDVTGDGGNGEKKDGKEDETIKRSEIEGLVQSAIDRATNKLGNENKQLKEQLEKLQKERMTAEEIKEMELAEKLKTIEEKERLLKQRELREQAVKTLREYKLDDGSDASLALVDFIMGEDSDAINAKAKTLKGLLDGITKSNVEKRFKESGRSDMSGGAGSGNGGGEGNDDDAAVKFAKELGEKAAANSKETKSVLSQYTGGANSETGGE